MVVVGISSAVCSILGVGFLGYLVVLARRGTDDREQAERDREFLAEHGHWPDEPPPTQATTR